MSLQFCFQLSASTSIPYKMLVGTVNMHHKNKSIQVHEWMQQEFKDTDN